MNKNLILRDKLYSKETDLSINFSDVKIKIFSLRNKVKCTLEGHLDHVLDLI